MFRLVIVFIFLFFVVQIKCQNIPKNNSISFKNDTLKIKKLLDLGDQLHYSKPDSAFFYYKKAQNLSEKINNTKFQALSFLNIGQHYNYIKNYNESIKYCIKALELYSKIKDKNGVANCYSFIGFSFSYLNSLEKSTEYYLKAADTYKEVNNLNGIADAYSGIANMYYGVEDYKKAINYYQKAQELFEKTKNKKGLLSLYINIGNAFADNGDFEKGVESYYKSIALTNELKDFEGTAINYLNLADCYIVKNNIKTALEYLNKSNEIIEKYNYSALFLTIYDMYSKVFLLDKNYKKCIYYAHKSLEHSKNNSWIETEFNNYKLLTEAYEGLGDYKNSLKYSKLFNTASDSLLKLKKLEQVIKTENLHEVEIKEKRINELLKNKELTSIKLKNQTTIGAFLGLFVILLIVIIIILFKHKKERKKTIELLIIEKEKAQESDKLKSAFLANMSHEIRTPMNAILGFSGFLKDPNLSETKRNKFIDVITKSGVRLLTIINDIVDISKLESNLLQLKFKEVNVIATLKEVVEIQKKSNELLIKKNLEIRLNIPSEPTANLLINTDEHRFVQILNNLINNAVKFTEIGFIEVGFELKIHNNFNFIQFYVQDTGCGIPSDKFDIIFERFSQTGDVYFKEGNGLGLSISKGLLELLKGTIWLESEVGKGSTFYFTLPI